MTLSQTFEERDKHLENQIGSWLLLCHKLMSRWQDAVIYTSYTDWFDFQKKCRTVTFHNTYITPMGTNYRVLLMLHDDHKNGYEH